MGGNNEPMEEKQLAKYRDLKGKAFFCLKLLQIKSNNCVLWRLSCLQPQSGRKQNF